MGKTDLIQIRTNAKQKEKIKKQAEARSMNMTEFILSRCSKADMEDRIEEMFNKIIIELKGGKKNYDRR